MGTTLQEIFLALNCPALSYTGLQCSGSDSYYNKPLYWYRDRNPFQSAPQASRKMLSIPYHGVNTSPPRKSVMNYLQRTYPISHMTTDEDSAVFRKGKQN
uniref:Uncharacterized protein n=1 Tax=Magallana gigas TaxID=29159 RepID=A0A8W8MDU9_MAGGI